MAIRAPDGANNIEYHTRTSIMIHFYTMNYNIHHFHVFSCNELKVYLIISKVTSQHNLNWPFPVSCDNLPWEIFLHLRNSFTWEIRGHSLKCWRTTLQFSNPQNNIYGLILSNFASISLNAVSRNAWTQMFYFLLIITLGNVNGSEPN